MEDFNALGNIQFGKDYVLFSLNPKIYGLDVVKKAALAFSESACVILDGEPETEILVELRPLNNNLPLKQLAEGFNQILLKHAHRKE